MMNASKTAQLEEALQTLTRRWGEGVVRPLTEIHGQTLSLCSGFPALDAALAPAGIPTGALTELFGLPSSGMTTFAYHLIAAAQSSGRSAIYIDLEGTFNPTHARLTGVALDRLFLSLPGSDLRMLDVARDLLVSGSIGIIALDIGQTSLADERLYRLSTFLMHAQCVLLRMEMRSPRRDPRQVPHSSPASLRLLIERQRWIEAHGDVIGSRAQVHILKSRHGAGRSVPLDLYFDALPPQIQANQR